MGQNKNIVKITICQKKWKDHKWAQKKDCIYHKRSQKKDSIAHKRKLEKPQGTTKEILWKDHNTQNKKAKKP